MFNEPMEHYYTEKPDLISKARLIKSLENLPAQFSVEELLDRLLLVKKIEVGLRQLEDDKTSSTEEARKKLEKWLK